MKHISQMNSWALGLALGLALPLAAADWPMARGNPGLTGQTAEPLADALVLQWKFKVGSPIKSSAAMAAGGVYVGADDESLYALDLDRGQQRWKFKTKGPIEGTPLVLGSRVFIGSVDGFVYALDAKTGALAWKFETKDKIVGGLNWMTAPDGKGQRVLVGSWDFNLYALDAQTGKPAWTFQCQERINGTPAVVRGQTLFGGCDGLLHVVQLDKGIEVKAIEAGAPIAASAAAEGERVYVGHMQDEFLCFDITQGKVIWRYRDRPFNFESSPALTQKWVIIGSQDKRLHCLDRATGKVKWVFITRGRVHSSPVVVGNRVLVGSDDGRLYLLTLDKGEQVWTYETGDAISASPAVANGRVVIGSEDGFVYCFGPKKP